MPERRHGTDDEAKLTQGWNWGFDLLVAAMIC
jgi:hypothetical protein